MIDQYKCCLKLISLLLILHCGAAQLAQFNPYAKSRSLPQLQQQHHHLFDAAQNTQPQLPQSPPPYPNQEFVEHQQLFYQYQEPGVIPSPSPTTTTPTQLWSGPPIVVGGDDYAATSYSNVNADHSNNRVLLSMHRSPKELPVYGNRQVPQQRPPFPLQPSHFNYGNQVIYHSDVRRHQINASPDESNYHQAEQQPPQPQPHQLYASNTDLNYLRAVLHSNGDKEGLAGMQTTNAVDYSEHFKEYLRKHPSRLRPMY